MTDTPLSKKAYMKLWRSSHKENISLRNKLFRDSHPNYQTQWKLSHPNYQRILRASKLDYRKLWNIRYPDRNADNQAYRKRLLTRIAAVSSHFSSMKPNPSEYADFPLVAQEVINLTGCKFLENNHFCNQPKIIGKPYCPIHSLTCYLPGNHTDKLMKSLEIR